MFLMLAGCVFAHQLVVNSFRKVEQWPFRAVAIRLIEMCGRALIIPLSLYMYGQTFAGDDLEGYKTLALQIPVLLLFVSIIVRESFGVRKSVRNGMMAIREKIEEDKRRNSWWELFIVNLYFFGIINITTNPTMSRKRRMQRQQESVEMNKLHTISSPNGNEPVENEIEMQHKQGTTENKRRRSSLFSRIRRMSLYDSDDEV